MENLFGAPLDDDTMWFDEVKDYMGPPIYDDDPYPILQDTTIKDYTDPSIYGDYPSTDFQSPDYSSMDFPSPTLQVKYLSSRLLLEKILSRMLPEEILFDDIYDDYSLPTVSDIFNVLIVVVLVITFKRANFLWEKINVKYKAMADVRSWEMHFEFLMTFERDSFEDEATHGLRENHFVAEENDENNDEIIFISCIFILVP
ncbi:hypothetical protein OROMI_022974 [Orobanche minor]